MYKYKIPTKREWLISVILIVLFGFTLLSLIFSTSLVQGGSMSPTLQDGDKVIFNKAIYFLEEPSRGDIVVIKKPVKNYVKRIIGLPNEVIEVKENDLYINGESYNQNFLEEGRDNIYEFGPITIPEESYFVMGDNRDISIDSRNGLGFITKEEIIGRSELILFPFEDIGQTR
ncbi:signal peptidase I [Aquibacillus halophilus]|uniref:Signal peptidase I n=1 Tax=Aquibacillus halophilus TaxID=930132 RepID=A0A6A8D8E2_9BACI|nr:signal peptidase I [Aquibacillus halophilus]MRH41864.1 signal peptidase I [Aquibacillus halophilus]